MEKIIHSEIVFRCPIFSVEYAKVETHFSKVEERWYVLKNNAVGIIALNQENEIILLKEFRSGAQEIQWRIPAGSINPGESPEVAARRELREEIGLDSNNLIFFKEFKNSTGWIKQSSLFYVAKDLFNSSLKSDESEFIEIKPTPISIVKKLLKENEIKGNISEALRLFINENNL